MRFFQYIFGFAILILLQEFVLLDINLFGVMNIMIYLMVIIEIPMEIRGARLLFAGLAMGAVVDLFQGTEALSSICMVWVAFARPTVLNLTLGRDVVVGGGMPRSSRVGSGHFLRYVFLMSLLYSTPYFLLEIMTFEGILTTMLRIVLSSAATTALIYVLHLPLSRKDSVV